MNESALPELPGGWVWTLLGKVCFTTSGGTPSRKNKNYFGGNIPWLKSGELNNGIIKSAEESITEEALKNSSTKIIPKGTLLIALYGATVGKLGILGIDAAINQAVCAISTNNSLDQKFLFWYLRGFRNELLNSRIGGAQPNISQQIINEVPIPLPPLPEQGRIVTKIEELFTRLDAGVSELKKTQVQLKRYRQSVLKAACEGELVPTEAELARAEGREYQAADVVLAHISKEWRDKAGKGTKYKEPAVLDMSVLPELPEGWMWTRVGEITEKIEKVSPEDKPETEFIYLDISSIDNRHLKIIEPKKYLGKDAPSRAKQKVKAGDVLFSTVRTYLKNIAQVPKIYDGQIASTGFSILRSSTGINENYLFYYVQTEQFLNPLTDIQRGTSYPAVRDSDVREQIFPVPPLAEQLRIVAEVERRLSVADVVERNVEQSLRQAERLRQSILKQAFKGKLVEQNLNDEPARVLLEQIKKEKSKFGNKKIIKIGYIKRDKMEEREKEIIEVNAEGLYEILRFSKKPVSPKELKHLSKLEIDDFYAELKIEVENGRIIERRPNDIDVYLEIGR